MDNCFWKIVFYCNVLGDNCFSVCIVFWGCFLDFTNYLFCFFSCNIEMLIFANSSSFFSRFCFRWRGLWSCNWTFTNCLELCWRHISLLLFIYSRSLRTSNFLRWGFHRSYFLFFLFEDLDLTIFLCMRCTLWRWLWWRFFNLLLLGWTFNLLWLNDSRRCWSFLWRWKGAWCSQLVMHDKNHTSKLQSFNYYC